MPGIYDSLFVLYQRIPVKKKLGNPIYMDMCRRHLTDLARVPWNRTGHDLFTDPDTTARPGCGGTAT